MQANMGTLGQIVAPLMEGPTQVYPQAAPVAAMAMGPNYQSFRQGLQQQIAAVAARKAEQERNALLEKQELARLQEQEKDRRQECLVSDGRDGVHIVEVKRYTAFFVLASRKSKESSRGSGKGWASSALHSEAKRA